MKISKCKISGFRNIKSAEFRLNKVNTVIGANNAGKSNLLYALSLPFSFDESMYKNKKLDVNDINKEVMEDFLSYISNNIVNIIQSNEIDIAIIPKIEITVELEFDALEHIYVKDILSFDLSYASLKYEFTIKEKEIIVLIDNIKSLYKDDKSTFEDIAKLKKYKEVLFKSDMFEYKIINPTSNIELNSKTRNYFKYNLIDTDRDNFSGNNSKIGSKLLVNILSNNLDNDSMIKLAKSYEKFYEDVISSTSMDDVINFIRSKDLENIEDFFSTLSIVPNLPNAKNLLESVALSIDEEPLSEQGLGYRNLTLLFILVSELIETTSDTGLNLLMIEEPESHLCISNLSLFLSLIKVIETKTERGQLILTSHSTNSINRLELENVIVVTDNDVINMGEYFTKKELSYISVIRNFDVMKFLFARKVILVEGITEEILIKGYVKKNLKLTDVEVVNFQKGYKDIIKFWQKINKNSLHKIAVIRDFDDQNNAKIEHERVCENCNRSKSFTTIGYSLEEEILSVENNEEEIKKLLIDNSVLKEEDDLLKKWKKHKSKYMKLIVESYITCDDYEIILPPHIMDALNFMEPQNGKN